MASAFRSGLARPTASSLRLRLRLPLASHPAAQPSSSSSSSSSSCSSFSDDSSASSARAASLPAAIASTASTTPPLLLPQRRCFSTTRAALATGYPRQGLPRDQPAGAPLPIPRPHARDEHIPAYPYGPRRVYKQSNAGLYGAARIQFGNIVSPKHNVKAPRKWRPNVQRKRLWSPALGCFVQTRVTTRVLRTIDNCGGLDEYLLGGKAQRLKDLGPWGWKLRWRLMQSDAVRNRFIEERKRLGLIPDTAAEGMPEEWAAVAKAMDDAKKQQMMAEMDRMLKAGEEFSLGPDEAFLGDK